MSTNQRQFLNAFIVTLTIVAGANIFWAVIASVLCTLEGDGCYGTAALGGLVLIILNMFVVGRVLVSSTRRLNEGRRIAAFGFLAGMAVGFMAGFSGCFALISGTGIL